MTGDEPDGTTGTEGAPLPGPHDAPPDETDDTDDLDDRPPIRGGWVGRQWPLLLVLGSGFSGLVLVALDHFRPGCLLIGSSVLVAAVARTVLPARRVGLLVVRSRAFDVLVLLVLGVSLVVLALVVPPAPE